jgi:hypothetical protein
VGELEGYYGMSHASYNIILVPLFCGGYGPRITTENDSYHIYTITGPMGWEGGYPQFGSAENLQSLIEHEFGHSFINPLTAEHGRILSRYSSLLDPISDKMSRQAYPEWRTCVNEHIIRAISIRLNQSEQAFGNDIEVQKSNGFFYLEFLLKSLEEYEHQRDRYPSMADFMPRLIDVFRELHEKKLPEEFFFLPFRGTINAVSMNSDPEYLIMILPTNEEDKAAEKGIHEYVKKIRDSMLKKATITTDKKALKIDLANNAIFAYGTMKGNSWALKHLSGIPVEIRENGIKIDTWYPGENLRFITAWPNPCNSERGVVFYTAQKAEDVVNIHSVFHGPTDYVVARKTDVLKAGTYEKYDGKWKKP